MTARVALALPSLYVAVLATWLALESGLGSLDALDLTGFGQALIVGHLLLAWVWGGWLAQSDEPAAAWWGGAGLVLMPAPLYTIAILMGVLAWNVAATIHLAAAVLVVAALSGGRRLGRRLVHPAPRRLVFTLLQAGPAIALWALRPVWLPLAGWPA